MHGTRIRPLLALPLLLIATGYSVAEEKVVIPFDFESKFDSGDYGQRLGDMIWKKLEREGKFIIPETMLDVRDMCERNRFHPNPETKLEDVASVVRDDFGAHIGIWGSIERVPPNKLDVYDIVLKAADFSTDPPTILFDEKARTESVSEIPHIYVKRLLDRLHGTMPAPAAGPNVAAETRWLSAPNLVPGGDFEKGSRSPAGWDPLPKHITLVKAGESRAIHMDLPESVAATTGVLYYSDFFPVEEGATYRFSCRFKTTGSQPKVFIKCYDEFGARTVGDTGKNEAQRREVYRSQQNMKGDANVWHTHVEDFMPKHPKFTPRFGRVMLYAYWPKGEVEWDDIIVKKIADAK